MLMSQYYSQFSDARDCHDRYEQKIRRSQSVLHGHQLKFALAVVTILE